DAVRASMFVHDHGNLGGRAAHRSQDGVQRRARRNKGNRANLILTQSSAFMNPASDISYVDHSNDVVQVMCVHGVPGMRVLDNGGDDLVEARTHFDAADHDSWNHHLTGCALPKFDQLFDHISGFAAEHADALGVPNQVLQLFTRI